MIFRAAFGYDTKAASDEAAVAFLPEEGWGPSLTVQSQAEDADINVMMRRFGVTKDASFLETGRVPTYEDFTDVVDYRSALHRVMDAQDNFMLLPPGVRARFDNDPQNFLEFASDPANIDSMREMGLAKPKVEVVPPVEVAK